MTEYGLATIRTERTGPGVLLATLDRPERLNALDSQMWDDLVELVDRVEQDRETRVLTITGNGRGFCAGADLEFISEVPGMTAQQFMRQQERGGRAIAKLRHLSTPVIAAVNGPATGGGLAIALAADLRIAVPAARFNVAFVRLGLSGCDVGVSWLLSRVVGMGYASELMLTGRLIDADEALRIGLVHRVVEHDQLAAAVQELAAEVAANSPFGLRLTKQALQINVDAPSLEAAIELENRNQVLASRTEDMAEAIEAFLAKRTPAFHDR